MLRTNGVPFIIQVPSGVKCAYMQIYTYMLLLNNRIVLVSHWYPATGFFSKDKPTIPLSTYHIWFGTYSFTFLLTVVQTSLWKESLTSWVDPRIKVAKQRFLPVHFLYTRISINQKVSSATIQQVLPGNLTWNLKIYHPKWRVVFQPSSLRGYVKLRGCKIWINLMAPVLVPHTSPRRRWIPPSS